MELRVGQLAYKTLYTPMRHPKRLRENDLEL